MKSVSKFTALTLTGVILAACGGRVANPVALSNDFDASLSCTHLSGELDNNNKRLVEILGERNAKAGRNLGTALFINPIFIDLSQSQKKEATALTARNERIISIGTQKSCPFSEDKTKEENSS